MGLRKKILCSEPTGEITKEQQAKLDLAWKVLCEKGSVNPVNPLDTDDKSIKEMIQQPGVYLMDYYNDNGVPYDEFIKQITEGDSNEK